jgi:hypothetical protein
MTTPDSQPSVFSAESYFGTQLPPPTLDSDIAGVRSFVHRQRDLGRKVVLVTVSVAPAPSLHAQNLSLSQEWRDNRPVGAQRVSMCFLPLRRLGVLKAHSSPLCGRPGCAFWITSAPVGCLPGRR